MKKVIIPIIIVGLAIGIWRGTTSNHFRSWWAEITKPALPAAENTPAVIANRLVAPAVNAAINRYQNLNGAVNDESLPAAKNLAVPFTSQAPDANWDEEHEEFCEEAALLMVGRYYQGRGFSSTADAETALQEIKQWELDHFGFYKDTTAAETAQILEGMYNLRVQLVNNPTVEDIKRAIAAGHPIVVPSAGRLLGNPNFKHPGPLYHMLVIKGYLKDGRLITNDPGTRKGADYIYSAAVILNAMHDWNGGDVNNGQPVMLVVSK